MLLLKSSYAFYRARCRTGLVSLCCALRGNRPHSSCTALPSRSVELSVDIAVFGYTAQRVLSQIFTWFVSLTPYVCVCVCGSGGRSDDPLEQAAGHKPRHRIFAKQDSLFVLFCLPSNSLLACVFISPRTSLSPSRLLAAQQGMNSYVRLYPRIHRHTATTASSPRKRRSHAFFSANINKWLHWQTVRAPRR